MRLALFEPEIPQNTGAAIRVAACFAASLDIVEPCGFPLSEKSLKRAAMDYAGAVETRTHRDWTAFDKTRRADGDRLILLTTKSDTSIWSFDFLETDRLLIGREGSGAPAEVHEAADARLRIPLAPGARSLNMAVSAGIALAEARRQLGFPGA